MVNNVDKKLQTYNEWHYIHMNFDSIQRFNKNQCFETTYKKTLEKIFNTLEINGGYSKLRHFYGAPDTVDFIITTSIISSCPLRIVHKTSTQISTQMSFSKSRERSIKFCGLLHTSWQHLLRRSIVTGQL